MLSSESQKYFRSAIPMSGTADCMWGLSQDKHHLDVAYQIAKDFGEAKNSYDDLVTFFKSVPADKLNKYSTVIELNLMYKIQFGPIVEGKWAESKSWKTYCILYTV